MHVVSCMSAKLAAFNRKKYDDGGAVRILKQLSLALLGGLTGYVLWALFFDYTFLSALASSLIVNRRNEAFLATILGNENHIIAVMLFFAAMLRTLPASVISGALMGFLLPQIRFKRTLCYAVLIWPFALYAWAFIGGLYESNRGVYMLQALAIYALFYVSVFVSFKLFKKEKQ